MTQALPDFRHSEAISIVTLGRLSKIAPSTPRGTRRRLTLRPLGSFQPPITSPPVAHLPPPDHPTHRARHPATCPLVVFFPIHLVRGQAQPVERRIGQA